MSLKFKKYLLILHIVIYLATFSYQVAANTSESYSVAVSTKVRGIILIELPGQIELKNYEPDLDSTAFNTVTVMTNFLYWKMVSNNLDGGQVQLDSGEEKIDARIQIKVGTNKKVTLTGKPILLCTGGQGINSEDLVISQRNSWSSVVPDYETPIGLTASMIV